MKTLSYTSPCNIQLLQQELDAAFPQYRGTVLPNGNFKDPLMRTDHLDDDVWIYVPDDADEDAFDDVVMDHIHSGETEHQERRRVSNQERVNLCNSNDNASAKMCDLKNLAKAVGVEWIW